MELRNAFERLHNLFGETEADDLPPRISVIGDTAYLDGRTAEREEYTLYVREDGPAAWGAHVDVPAHSWIRRDGGGRWWQNEEEKRFWVTCVGSTLDVIYVDADGALRWDSYTSEDIDG